MLIQDWKKRSEFLRKHHLVAGIGENVRWATRWYPIDGSQLRLHSNIVVARDVNFIMHDEVHLVLNTMSPDRGWGTSGWINQEYGCIEVMDNVFIGSGVQVCPNVRVGPNAVVAAGAVVTKDVPPNSVVAGVPAKVIGTFEDLEAKRVLMSKRFDGMTKDQKVERAWDEFYEAHNILQYR